MADVSPHVIAVAGPNGAGKTTLAPFRSYAHLITRLRAEGYEFHLIYIWLSSADLAVERVRERVRRGGHDVAEDVIRRRYVSGARNFFAVYSGLADTWGVYDNSKPGDSVEVAIKNKNIPPEILREDLWRRLREVTE